MKKILLMSLLFMIIMSGVGMSEQQTKTNKLIIMETSLGIIKIELFDEKSPVTTANFRKYIQQAFYDGLIFHRVIPGFMVQGGGFEPGMKKRTPTHMAIKNEADNNLKNKRGTLSMARTQKIDSATSQFFINVKDNPSLDHRGKHPNQYGYAVFGQVVYGMSVLDKIVAVPTTMIGRHQNVPAKDVIIIKAYEE